MFKKSISSDRRTGTTTKKIITLSLVALLLGYLLRIFTRNEKVYEAEPETTKPDNPPQATTPQNLKVVEGIGPKIESILYARGINTLGRLASTEPEQLRDILRQEGPRYLAHDPTTWPKQASLAAADDWNELNAYKSQLKGGREVK
jgi:hypothetical protein